MNKFLGTAVASRSVLPIRPGGARPEPQGFLHHVRGSGRGRRRWPGDLGSFHQHGGGHRGILRGREQCVSRLRADALTPCSLGLLPV